MFSREFCWTRNLTVYRWSPQVSFTIGGKILERIVYARLKNVIEEKNLLPSVQFGFRKGHSTIHQAIRIKKFITRNKSNKKSTGMILLDIGKVFDSVWHDGLIYKLMKMNLPRYLIRIINAFIRNRKFIVKVNDCVSHKVNIPASLAQGTCISTILYALFVSDMTTIDNIENAFICWRYIRKIITFYGSKMLKYHHQKNQHFASDSAGILRQMENKTERKQNTRNYSSINCKRIRIPRIPLMNGQHTIEVDDSVNYLDKMLLFKQHITHATNKTNKCPRALFPMIAARSRFSIGNKLLIFTAVLRPIMSYGCPVWSSAAMTHLKKLNILQNKLLKINFRL